MGKAVFSLARPDRIRSLGIITAFSVFLFSVFLSSTASAQLLGMNQNLFDSRAGNLGTLPYPANTDASNSVAVCSIIAYEPATDDDMGVMCTLEYKRWGIEVNLTRLDSNKGYFVAQAIVLNTNIWEVGGPSRFEVAGDGGTASGRLFIPDDGRPGVLIRVVDAILPAEDDRLSYALNLNTANTIRAWGASWSAKVRGSYFTLKAPSGLSVTQLNPRLLKQGDLFSDPQAMRVVTFASMISYVSDEPDFGVAFNLQNGPTWIGVNGDDSSRALIQEWRFQ